MRNRQSSRGIMVPSLWHIIAAGAAVCCGWLVWTRVREQYVVPDVTTKSIDDLQRFEKLAALGIDGVPPLVDELSDVNPRIRCQALLALARVGPDAMSALAKVRERVADDDGGVRTSAIYSYGRISRDVADVVRTIAPTLADNEAQVRRKAEETLRAMGADAEGPLISVLQHESAAVRMRAVGVLRGIHKGKPPAVSQGSRRHNCGVRISDSTAGAPAAVFSSSQGLGIIAGCRGPRRARAAAAGRAGRRPRAPGDCQSNACRGRRDI
jgi:HEAT repeat protein